MKVTSRNSGRHLESGAGYGLKLSSEDRDAFFDRSWTAVFVQLPKSWGQQSWGQESNLKQKSV